MSANLSNLVELNLPQIPLNQNPILGTIHLRVEFHLHNLINGICTRGGERRPQSERCEGKQRKGGWRQGIARHRGHHD